MMSNDVTSKLLGLPSDRRELPPGCMGGMLQYFDWNQAISAKQKFLLADRRFGDGIYSSQADFFAGSGTEAPRNSVDYSVADTPRSSHAKQEDVALAFSSAKCNFPGSNTAQSEFSTSYIQQGDIPAGSFPPSKLNFPANTSPLDFFSGLEAPRNSVDYSLSDTPRASYARQEDVPFGYEFPRNASVSPPRRFAGDALPKKDVMAEFESRRASPVIPSRMPSPSDAITEFESRRKAPGVVARLMGLDALPEATGSKSAKKEGFMADLSPEATVLQRARRTGKDSPQRKSASDGASTVQVSKKQPLSPRSIGETVLSPRKPQEIRILYPKQVPSPEGTPQRESPALPRGHVEPEHDVEKSGCEQLAFRDHPQEKQLQEFKKQFEAKLQPRDRFRINQLEGSDKEFEDKKILVRERLNEAKKTLGKEKLSEAKRLAARQRLKESKEFLEALEFLQYNREFFLRFLQEPLSSLAKQMHDEPGSPQRKHKADRKPRSPNRHTDYKREMLSPRSSARQLEEARKNREAKLLFRKQQGPKTPAELAIFSRARASSDGELGQPESQRDSPRTTDVENGLTRIVVLKPTPGRGSPLRSSSSPACSPLPYRTVSDRKDHCRQNVRDTRKEYRSDGGRQAVQDAGGSLSGDEVGRARSKGVPRDPREIAREIVRQAQENASKKLGEDPRSGSSSVLRYRATGKRVAVSRMGTDGGDVAGSSDADGCVTPSRLKPIRDSPGRSPSSSPRMKSTETMTNTGMGRDSKKRHPEKIKILQPAVSLEEPQQKAMSPLGRNASIINMSKAGPLLQGSSKTRELSKNIVEGLVENALPDLHLLADEKMSSKPPRLEKLVKTEKLPSVPSVGTDLVKEGPAVILTRSRSLPNSVLLGDWSSARDSVGPIVCQSPDTAPQSTNFKPSNEIPGEAVDASATRATDCDGANGSPTEDSHGAGIEHEAGSVASLQDPDDLQAADQVRQATDCIEDNSLQACLESPLPDAFSVEMHVPEASERLCEASVAIHTMPAPEEQVDESAAAGSASQCGCENLSNTGAQDKMAAAVKAPQQGQQIWSSFSSEALDGASEASVEKGGQPSPVSILDSPFEQESPQSPPSDFTEVRSDLQELRLRLQQLKLDGIQRPRDDLGDQEQAVLAAEEPQALRSDSRDSTCMSSTAAIGSLCSPSSHLKWQDLNSFVISFLPCPEGREDDLIYVRDLLVISGYIGGKGTSLSRWFSLSRPLDVSLFEKLEDLHTGSQARTKGALRNSGIPQEQQQRIDSMNRRVLFEVVNEVLLQNLGPYVNQLPWTKSSRLAQCSLPTDEQLMEETWREICTCHMPIEGANYTLENMVDRDLRRGRQWKLFEEEVEQVGMELERCILSDLLDDAIRDLLSLQCATQMCSAK